MHRRDVLKLGAATTLAAALNPESSPQSHLSRPQNPVTSSSGASSKSPSPAPPPAIPSKTSPSPRTSPRSIAPSRSKASTTATAPTASASCRTRPAAGATRPPAPPRELAGHTGALHLHSAPRPATTAPSPPRTSSTSSTPTARPTFPSAPPPTPTSSPPTRTPQNSLAGMTRPSSTRPASACCPSRWATTPSRCCPSQPTARRQRPRRQSQRLTRFNPAYFQHAREAPPGTAEGRHRGRPASSSTPTTPGATKPWAPKPTTSISATPSRDFPHIGTSGGPSPTNTTWSSAKTMSDWDRFFRIVQAEDPYSPPSLHPSLAASSTTTPSPGVTHASLQSYDFEKSADRRARLEQAHHLRRDSVRRRRRPPLGQSLRRGDDAPLLARHHPRRLRLPRRGLHLRRLRPARARIKLVRRRPSPRRIRPAHRVPARPRRSVSPRSASTSSRAPTISPPARRTSSILYYFDYHRPARYDFPLPDHRELLRDAHRSL